MRGHPAPGPVNVTVTFHGFAEKARTVEVPEGCSARDLLKVLGILPELVLVFRDRTPIPMTEMLVPGDSLRVLRVVSGG